MNNLEKNLRIVINILIVGVFISCTLIFREWIFPYITSKAIPFRILVELLSFFYLVLALYYPKYRPKKSILLLSIIIFTFITIITAIFGLNPKLSFVGDLERMWGINTWLHLVLFFIVLSNFLKTKKEWFVFLNVSLIFCSYIAFYGYLQRWNVSFVFQTGGQMIQSVLGNVSYTAGLLILGVLLSLYLLVTKKEWYFKLIFATHIFIQLPAMFLTQTRGAQVGLMAAILILGIYFIFRGSSKVLKISLIVFLLSIITFFGLAFANKDADWVKNNVITKRIVNISFAEGTVRTRLISWNGGWQAFKERPIFGYGMENYGYAFDKYFQADYYNIAPTEVWFDRAHNMVVETLVATGIFGILSYLSIFVILFYYLFKIHKTQQDEDEKIFSIFLAVIVVAYFIQNLFVFDTLAVTTMFFFIIAYIESSYNEVFDKKLLWEKISNSNWIIISFAGIIVFYFVLGMNMNHLNIAKQDYIVQRSFHQSTDFTDIYTNIEELFNYPGYLNKDSVSMTTDILTSSMSKINSQEKAEIFNNIYIFLIDKNKEYLKEDSKDAYTQLNLARLYMGKASMFSQDSDEFKNNLEESKKIIDYSIELSPQKLHNYFLRSRANLNLGKMDEALEDLQTALKYNDKYGTTYWLIGEVYSYMSVDKKIILDNIDNAIKHNHRFLLGDLKKAIALYGEDGYSDQRIFLYENIIKYENNPKYYSELGKLYQEKGMNDKAEENFNKASYLYNNTSTTTNIK
ncbi:MAG: O-antigen ligase family protein [Patescibacteria group bacterium]|nr:O-antigen ligase family protein [Patescibacteria group bacterium]MDD4304279.1 O-antigen ligase family protein [Patescibacteria group bacterium]MDD4695333.1 O-antigen ligase family protein [Patescibacteria group bacterium]